METPDSLTFTDFEIPLDQLFQHERGPMNLAWTRVQFTVPDGWQAPQAVQQWLRENTPGKWQAYSYSNPKGKAQDYIMVVRFKDKNDALMFKLRGGHQSWEAH